MVATQWALSIHVMADLGCAAHAHGSMTTWGYNNVLGIVVANDAVIFTILTYV
jgi:hypothetical protein